MIRFDPEGRVRMVFGRKPEASDENAHRSYGSERAQLNTLHSIAIDARDRIYIADRGNRRMARRSGSYPRVASPSENELYVAELLNWRAQKLLLH